MKAPAAATLLLAPALLLFLALFVYPQLHMLALSLDAPDWSVASYVHFLADSYYLGVLLRSLALGAVVTAVTLALGLPLAYWLARMESRLASVLLLLSTFPLWVSAVVRSFAWVILLGAQRPAAGRPAHPRAGRAIRSSSSTPSPASSSRWRR